MDISTTCGCTFKKSAIILARTCLLEKINKTEVHNSEDLANMAGTVPASGGKSPINAA